MVMVLALMALVAVMGSVYYVLCMSSVGTEDLLPCPANKQIATLYVTSIQDLGGLHECSRPLYGASLLV